MQTFISGKWTRVALACANSLSFLAIACPVAGQPITFVTAWGGIGTGDGQFSQPDDVAVDGSGQVFTVDSNLWRVQKFTSSGAFIASWSVYAFGGDPRGIGVDASGNVYVASDWYVLVYANDGTFLAQWGTYGAGTGDGQFQGASDVAVDAAGNVFVVDEDLGRVQKFATDGTYLMQWGTPGLGDGELGNPTAVDVDDAGNVYVAEAGAYRIQKFDGNGTFLAKWWSRAPGGTPGQWEGDQPHGVAVDRAGNIYLTDRDNHRVQKLDSTGTFVTRWGTQGTDPGQFHFPRGIAVDDSGGIYVCDQGANRRIQKFEDGAVPVELLSFTIE